MSALLIALGLLCVGVSINSPLKLTARDRPQYWEIWKRKEVVGKP
jgi:hypothetical protein